MTYPLPSNITTLTSLLQWTNIFSGNWFWSVVIMSSLVVVFSWIAKSEYAKENIGRALVGTMFFNLIFAIFLRMFGLVGNTLIGMLLTGLAGTVMFLYVTK